MIPTTIAGDAKLPGHLDHLVRILEQLDRAGDGPVPEHPAREPRHAHNRPQRDHEDEYPDPVIERRKAELAFDDLRGKDRDEDREVPGVETRVTTSVSQAPISIQQSCAWAQHQIASAK